MFAAADGAVLASLLTEHRDDPRAGAQAIVRSARRRCDAGAAESNRQRELCAQEEDLYAQGLTIVAGVDEVGRGALAGPVTAGACVFAPGTEIAGLTDSKALTPRRRTELDLEIRSVAIATAVAHVGHERIDEIGISRATVEAMRAAVEALGIAVEHVLVDGLPVDLGRPSTAIVKGDARVRAIAAASVLAKVSRDALLVELSEHYPGYRLEGNKGYGCPVHLEALRSLGPSPIHRLSFGPCAQERLF